MSEDKEASQEGQKKRSVVIAPVAKVIFESKTKPEVHVETVKRDLFSVADSIGQRLQATTSKDDMEDVLVSVHSVEDPGKSDPLPDGEERWEGEYLVGGLSIEKQSIPDAMRALTGAIIPADAATKGIERLAEQLFLRSFLDGFVFIATFNGQPAVIPLVSSFKEPSAQCFVTLYRQLHQQAENLKAWVESKFPDVAKVSNWTGEDKSKNNNASSGLVLPNGAPVETRKNPKLTVVGGCGKSCRRK